MKKRDYYKKYGYKYLWRKIGLIAPIVVIALVILSMPFWNKQTQEHKVLRVDMIQNTQGSSDYFYTDVYYVVITDKGTYLISTSGFNAGLNCSAIEEGETYIMTTRGVRIPFIGKYPKIISYKI